MSPSLPLAAYAEGWISGAKVVVFGCATSGLPERLLERGARQVQVYDPDPARALEATAVSRDRRLAFAPMEPAGPSARDGSFDFGIIEDLAGAGAQPAEWLAHLRRSISRRGIGLVAARNPDAARPLLARSAPASAALGYYDLYDALSQHWDEVRMLGQTPFVGYAIADFSAADEPEVRIDTGFVPGGAEEPEWFLALVSALPVPAEAFSVIQLPFAELELPLTPSAGESVETVAPADDARLVEAREELRTARDQLSVLQAELAAARAELSQSSAQRTAREQLSRLQAELAAARAELSQGSAQRQGSAQKYESQLASLREELSQSSAQRQGSAQKYESQLASLREELRKREEWLAGLESRAATADQRADEMQSELDLRKTEIARAEREVKRLEQRLEEEQRERRTLSEKGERELAKAKKQAEEEGRRAQRLEEELHGVGRRIADLTRELEAAREAPPPDADAEAEVRALEAQLRERAAEVARLTGELHETERFGRQLISELNHLKEAAQSEAGSRELGRLAQRNAELEADLEAARWTISSLEASIPEEPTLATGSGPSGWGTPEAESPSAPGGD